MKRTSVNNSSQKKVHIEFTPTFDEKRGEHGYAVDRLSEDELRTLAAPALAGFKGESLQQARLTIDGENFVSPIELPPIPIDKEQYAVSRALKVLDEQQNRDSNSGFLGASNAHLQPSRRNQ